MNSTSSGSFPVPMLLYDGECGLCNRFLQWILRCDTRGTLHYASLQGSVGTTLRLLHPEIQLVDSMIWIDQVGDTPRCYNRSAAVFRICEYLGGRWTLARLAWLLPPRLRDSMYDVVAVNRYRWFGRPARCVRPNIDQLARFLD